MRAWSSERTVGVASEIGPKCATKVQHWIKGTKLENRKVEEAVDELWNVISIKENVKEIRKIGGVDREGRGLVLMRKAFEGKKRVMEAKKRLRDRRERIEDDLTREERRGRRKIERERRKERRKKVKESR